MLKAGLLPAPIIQPLRYDTIGTRIRVDSNTYIQIRTGLFILFASENRVLYVTFKNIFLIFIFKMFLERKFTSLQMELSLILFKLDERARPRLTVI
jgi:hypothetical protein